MTAYAFGKPVVATRVGCLPEYVQDGETGFLVAPADEGELAKAIAHLLTDDVLRSQMRHNIARWLELRQAGIAKQTLETYEKALAHRRGKHGL